MSCVHDNPRGQCPMCRMEELEGRFGLPEDHIEGEIAEDES